MKLSRLWLLLWVLVAAWALAQSPPGKANERISRYPKGATPGVTDGGGEVQFNQGGTLGGTANAISDGVDIHYLPYIIPTHPNTPPVGSTMFDNVLDSGMPQIPMRIDAFMKYPIPQIFAGGGNGFFVGLGSYMNWQCHCYMPNTWNSSLTYAFGSNTALTLQTSGTAAVAWSNSFPNGRLKHITTQGTATANSFTSMFGPEFTTSRGNSAGAGGFLYWNRFWLQTTASCESSVAGLFNSVSTFSNVQPSTLANTIYFGNDQGPDPASSQPNLHVCSNDNVGSATCADLGSSFPAQTANVAYDVWLYGAPGGGSVTWGIERLDSPAKQSGIITTDLPQTSVQLNWHTSTWNGPDSGVAVTPFLSFGGLCGCDNW